MEIEYDAGKSAKNEAERGLPFHKIIEMDWEKARIAHDHRQNEEARFVAQGKLDGRLHVVCFTIRGEKLRVISFRKANKREEKLYEETEKTIDG